MANQWFRMYHEFATDPKIQMLSEADQRRYVMLLCLRCSNEHVTLHDTEVAFQLRISNEQWLETKKILQSKNLINEDNQPANWDKRQFESDSSSARVKAYRERKKAEEEARKKTEGKVCNDDETLQKRNVNALDTDTDTDTDKTHTPSADGSESVEPDPGPEKPNYTQADLRKLHPELPKDLISEWFLVRKDKNAKSLTKTAWAAFQREAGKAGLSLVDAMTISVKRGWRGFEASWLDNQNPTPSGPHSGKPQGMRNIKPMPIPGRTM